MQTDQHNGATYTYPSQPQHFIPAPSNPATRIKHRAAAAARSLTISINVDRRRKNQ